MKFIIKNYNKTTIIINIISLFIIINWIYNKYGYLFEYYLNRYIFYSNITLKPSKSKNLLLLSNSTMTKFGPDQHLDYALPIINNFLKPHNIKEILLIPYASSDVRDGINTYFVSKKILPQAKETFQKIGINVVLLDAELSNSNQQEIIRNAQAIYICGGNTFVLTKTLYEKNVIDIIKQKIRDGTPVIGASAGTNIHCPTMRTTNDMPIVCVNDCQVLNSIPFQINVHYNTFESPSGFRGETRDQRIKEFLENNRTFDSTTIPTFVLGLREGSMIHISDDQGELLGFQSRPAELLMLNENGELVKKKINIGSRIDNLLKLNPLL